MAIARKLLSLALCKKAVLIDFDNTLYRYDPCHAKAFRALHSEYRKICEPLSLKQFETEYTRAQKQVKSRTRTQAASHSRLLYLQVLIENRFGCTCPAETLRLEKVYWDTFLKSMCVEKWVLPFLKELRKNKIKSAIVTDLTAAIQMRKLEKLGLSKWVDFLISSEEAGVEKPDKKIFEYAFKKLSCKPAEALLVGDNPARDRCAGVTTYRV